MRLSGVPVIRAVAAAGKLWLETCLLDSTASTLSIFSSMNLLKSPYLPKI